MYDRTSACMQDMHDRTSACMQDMYDLGCYNFLSGAGGWAQSLTNGFAGINIIIGCTHGG